MHRAERFQRSCVTGIFIDAKQSLVSCSDETRKPSMLQSELSLVERLNAAIQHTSSITATKSPDPYSCKWYPMVTKGKVYGLKTLPSSRDTSFSPTKVRVDKHHSLSSINAIYTQ
ncbi:hypothetical protein N7G274_008790 [Stereocaulon virgatum]|uniref:Uncharacterized protein n=1 Tax=Stereocaulon virgatum TaxID=373712 RepID=A0ABR4A0G6_9LECA